MSKNLYSVGEELYDKGEYEQCIFWLNNSMEMAKEIRDDDLLFRSMTLMSYAFLEMGMYYDAESCIESLFKQNEELFSDDAKKIHYYIVFGIINMKLKYIHKSILNINDSIEVATRLMNEDSYYEKVLGRICMMSARIHFMNSNLSISSDYCKKSFELSKKYSDYISMANVKQLLGEIAYHDNHKRSAIAHFEEARTYALKCSRKHELIRINYWIYLCRNNTTKLHEQFLEMIKINMQKCDLAKYYYLTGNKILESSLNDLGDYYKKLSQCRDSFLKNKICEDIEKLIIQCRTANEYMYKGLEFLNEGR